MAKYRIRIEEGGYKEQFDLKTELGPEVVDKIIADIYETLSKYSSHQENPNA